MGELSEKLRGQAMGLRAAKKSESSSEESNDIQRIHREGMKERVYMHGLGIDPASAQRPGDDIRVNLGDLIKAQAESTKSLTDHILDIQKSNPESPFLKYMLDELKGVRAQLDAAKGQDPLESLVQAQTVLDNLAEKMKKREGISGDAPVWLVLMAVLPLHCVGYALSFGLHGNLKDQGIGPPQAVRGVTGWHRLHGNIREWPLTATLLPLHDIGVSLGHRGDARATNQGEPGRRGYTLWLYGLKSRHAICAT